MIHKHWVVAVLIIGFICVSVAAIARGDLNLMQVALSLVLVAFVVVNRRGERWEFLSPVGMWIIAFLIMYAVVPMSIHLGERNPSGTYTVAAGSINVGLVAFMLGYFSRVGTAISRCGAGLPTAWVGRRAFWAIGILMGISGVAYGTSIFLYGGFQHLEVLLFRQWIGSEGRAYLLYAVTIPANLGVVTAWVAFLSARRSRWLWFSIWLIAFIGAVAFFASFGIRGLILALPLALVICFHYLRGPIGFLSLVPLAMLAAVFIAIVGAARVAGGPYEVIARASTVASDARWFDLLRSRLVQRADHFTTFVEILDRYPSWRYGQSLVDLLLQPVPRSLYPDKPFKTGSLITRELYPEVAAAHVAFAASAFGEFYINFGILGIFVGFLALGVAVKAFQVYVVQHRRNRTVVAMYSLLAPALTWGWLEGGFNSGATEQMVFFGVLGWLVMRIIGRQTRTGRPL